MNFKSLRAKRIADIRLRNMGIAAVGLLSVGVIIWLNRKRRKALRAKQEAQQELERFTKNIQTKDEEIERLKNELQLQTRNREDAARIEELSQQMILTTDDWQNFQSLFNKTYPGYLLRLKEKAPGITEAETLMACLIKIKLNTRQIASMQGINLDSVHKARHRLRQRFSTATTSELEVLLASV